MRSHTLALSVTALFVPIQSISAAPADAFSEIPNVTFKYYDVSGTDKRAIRASMNAERPTDPNDGSPRDAITLYHFRWAFRMGADGCHGTVDFSADALLPRLSDEQNVPMNVLTSWHTYLENLLIHEAGHARFAYEHVDDIRKALEGPTCANANTSAKAVVSNLRLHDIDYDRQTEHGKSQGAIFP